MSSPVLDLAIGMIFIYLLMSLLCSALQELISNILKLRAKNLQHGVDSLLKDPNAAFFASEFHLHPLIDQLAPSGKYPSYIPASHFSAVVMDILDKHCDEDPFNNISAAVASLPDGQIKQSLRIMASRCKGEPEDFVRELEQWFDHGMDRASGWYKRKSQVMMLPLAIVLAVAMNVDSIQLAQNLWHDKTQRQAIVAMAAQYQNTGASGQSSPVDVQAVKRQFDQLPLPVGWDTKKSLCHSVGFLAILGWLITGCFVSLGAPFWFDALGKALSLRAAGKKPPRGRA